MDNNKIEMRESSSSVSFGKYENDDSIGWEKFSSFSSSPNNNNNNNKYLDEVGKLCSTPGSVAQKKAFFEAHYAAIKKKKAEADLLDQPSSSSTSTSDHHHDVQHNCLNNNEISTEDEYVKHQEDEHSATTSLDHQTFQGNALIPQPNINNKLQEEEEAVLVNNKILQDNASEAHSPIPINRNVDKLEEAVLVNNQSMRLVKQHFQLQPDTEFPNQQLPKPKPPRKVHPTKVENNLLGMKKKPASPETSSTRLSKPKSTTTPMTTPFNKPIASSSSSRSRNPSVSETRNITPTSLHLSMSMTSSVHSDTASSVTSSRRRSVFMEQMGDKDIVKRAFKTFQSRYNQLPASGGETKQLPTKGSGQKVSASTASEKENERSKKAAERIKHARGQTGPTWNSVSSGSLKGIGVDERRLNTSVVLTSNERAERRKMFFKNLEEKSNAREAERTQLSSRSKEAKDAEIKKLKQNPTFKAKPMPSFYRAQGLSKSTSEKEAIKNRATRQHDSHR